MTQHHYKATIEWTGNLGSGTSGYRDYERNHTIQAGNKPVIDCSSDPAFRGDPEKYNPEELFLASLSSCHMLWFLHLCSVEGIIITGYRDEPAGIMMEEKGGRGYFSEVILKPEVTVKEERMAEKLDSLHHKANKMCFIANSCNFEIKHEPKVNIQKPNEI
ncbi:MAG TPA: peroxiredoxin [Balneolaceae bacterium]|nr:peroxiredoxin [Balneolaceae bacterium]|tara:strand:- start:35918 stop:36400 length:483 start_codon:yes stop_codon:yes gene_type:complete